MASMFKVGTGSCAGRSVSPSFPGCGDILVFFLLLLSYIQMVYSLKHYHETPSILYL